MGRAAAEVDPRGAFRSVHFARLVESSHQEKRFFVERWESCRIPS